MLISVKYEAANRSGSRIWVQDASSAKLQIDQLTTSRGETVRPSYFPISHLFINHKLSETFMSSYTERERGKGGGGRGRGVEEIGTLSRSGKGSSALRARGGRRSKDNLAVTLKFRHFRLKFRGEPAAFTSIQLLTSCARRELPPAPCAIAQTSNFKFQMFFGLLISIIPMSLHH